MKKLLCLILAALTALSLLACNALSDVGSREPAASTTAPPITDALNETPVSPSWQTSVPENGSYTVTARFDYGGYKPEKAVLLYDCNLQFFNALSAVDTPIAGDVFELEYSGRMMLNETYPGTVGVDGEITSVTVIEAKVMRLAYFPQTETEAAKFVRMRDDGVEEVIEFDAAPQVVVQGSGVECTYRPLSEIERETVIYGTYSPLDDVADGIGILAFYQSRPRPTETVIHPNTLAAVEELNANSETLLDLYALHRECDLTGFEYTKSDGGQGYSKNGEHYTVWDGVYRREESYVTYIRLDAGCGTLLGLDGSETADEIIQTLESFGYNCQRSEYTGDIYASKYGVTVRFDLRADSWARSAYLSSPDRPGDYVGDDILFLG